MLFNLLTALIANRTESLACRLARSLTLAAATLLHGFLQISGCQSLDMLLHFKSLLIIIRYRLINMDSITNN